VESGRGTLTPRLSFRRTADCFQSAHHVAYRTAAPIALPGGEDRREEIPVFEPAILEAEKVGFWYGGGDFEEDGCVIGGRFW